MSLKKTSKEFFIIFYGSLFIVILISSFLIYVQLNKEHKVVEKTNEDLKLKVDIELSEKYIKLL